MSSEATAGGAERLRALARQAMIQRGLWPEFSPAALQQAQSIAPASTDAAGGASPSSPSEAHAPRDLRQLLWASIDNQDTLDLDQLSVAEPLAGGRVQVLIAIADVARLVARATAIDEHAAHNTTSVYTAAQVFAMLPERLSTDVSVLIAERARMALVVELEVDPDGIVARSDLYPAVVINQAKLSYEAVGDWLEGRAAAPARVTAVPGLAEQLRLQDRVAQSLKQVRQAHGALTLQTLQTRVLFRDDKPSGLHIEQPNHARNLIEEFMIAANAATAHFLDARGYPSLRRVLLPPERWDRIAALASACGEQLPAAPDVAALNRFLLQRRAADPARFADLSLAVVKLLGRGQYAAEPAGQATSGHFGLAISDYLHSTAPNRRFPDLLTQRLLHAALAGSAPPYSLEQLRQLAGRCTQQEDNAAKVERQVAKSAAAMLLSAHIGQQFEGIVTGASAKGTWIRVTAPPVEGRIVQGFEALDVGDRAQVRLVHTDIERGFIDFVRVRSGA